VNAQSDVLLISFGTHRSSILKGFCFEPVKGFGLGFQWGSVLGFRFDGGGGFVVVGFGLVRSSGWEVGGRKLVA